MNFGPLLTSEVARILDVSAETIRLWERSGRLPARKTEKGVRLFDRRDVERLARERQARERVK
jgi:excisionase family DNA binding protein